MQNQGQIILWDIDGTLLAAGNGGLEHYQLALREVAADPPAIELSTHGKTDWQVIHELLVASGLPVSHAERVSERLDQLSVSFLENDRPRLLPAVPETLSHLAQLGVRNGLLTGNSELRSRHKLAGAGLDLALIDWECSFFGSRAGQRSDITRAARNAFPQECLLVIGDTPFDGRAAAEAGIPFLAVCSGTYARAAFDGIASIGVADTLVIDEVRQALDVIK